MSAPSVEQSVGDLPNRSVPAGARRDPASRLQHGRDGIGDQSEGGGYLVDHTNITYLFGPEGEPIAILPTDEGPEAVAAELAKWVR